MPGLSRRALLSAAVAFATARAAHADPGGDFHGLVAQGEAALRANDADAALRAYERAAALRHEAIAEWGLVRSWMQLGEYRRALAFAAHAAGAHPDMVAGAGLYAWLLSIGGQPAIARQVLGEARRRSADHPALAETAARLDRPASATAAVLLEGAARQSPYAAMRLPLGARAVASGVLRADGLHALVPAEAVAMAATLWLRDAMGRTVPARVARTWPELGVAELAPDAPWREPHTGLVFAPRDAFPGSPEMAVEFAAAADLPAEPAWPVLQAGFVGRWLAGPRYALGAPLAATGAHGGPVFDRGGRLIGLALRGDDGAATLLASSALRDLWPEAAPPDAAVPAPTLSPDALYERAMSCVVQLIAQPRELAVQP